MWGRTTSRLAAVALGITALCCSSEAMGAERNEKLDNMSFTEMIYSVELGDLSDFISRFQKKEVRDTKLMQKFYNVDGCTIESTRNQEVVLVTIPAHLLFAPNETLLNDNAQKYLSPFKRYLYHPDYYRVLLVMHTDNTGSEEYRDIITEERVESVFEWFEDQGCDTSFLFPYAMSDEMPNFPNDSQTNRQANRRLEIYLMPGTKMVEQAKTGKMDFKTPAK